MNPPEFIEVSRQCTTELHAIQVCEYLKRRSIGFSDSIKIVPPTNLRFPYHDVVLTVQSDEKDLAEELLAEADDDSRAPSILDWKTGALEPEIARMIRGARHWELLGIARKASWAVIRFGKYADQTLGSIPLRYLDQTISPMPDQWIVRQARIVVDFIMSEYSPDDIPNKSYNDFLNE